MTRPDPLRDLAPYYERELVELRVLLDEFVAKNPAAAQAMSAGGDWRQDPDVEEMTHTFALLFARVRQRLDDDFPGFVESLLGQIQPHAARPVPACAIACFTAGGRADGAQPSALVTLARGTEVYAPLPNGGRILWRTTGEVRLAPLRIVSVGYRGAATAPAGTSVPAKTKAILSLELELTGRRQRWAELGVDALRLHVTGDAALTTALRETLTRHVLATLVQIPGRSAWHTDAQALPRQAGFERADALLEGDARPHEAYRLLTEYFAFPAKFDFVDLPLPSAALEAPPGRIVLHLALDGLPRAQEDEALLHAVTADNLRLNCAPVVNLYARRVSLANRRGGDGEGRGQGGGFSRSCRLVVDEGRADAEAQVIERVLRLDNNHPGEPPEVLPGLFSFGHGRGRGDDDPVVYWLAQAAADAQSPADGQWIRFVDEHEAPVDVDTAGLFVDVQAMDGDLPSRLLKAGAALRRQGSELEGVAHLLTAPTPVRRFPAGQDRRWRLVSQSSVNSLLLTGTGVEALKQILDLYDLPRGEANRRLRDGLITIESKAVLSRVDLDGAMTFARCKAITLAVDAAPARAVGLRLFGEVMGRFFALFAHESSLTRLCLTCSRTGAVLFTDERRAGAQPLL